MDDMKGDSKKLDYENEASKVTDPLKKDKPAAEGASFAYLDPRVKVTHIKSSKGITMTTLNSK